MKKLITGLVLLTFVGIVKADVTVLFPDGDFDSPAGASTNWVEGSCCGNFVFTYPATGGNPNGYGTIENQGPLDYYGLWVNGDTTPLPLGALGLVAGQTYTFVEDMKIVSGSNIGGFKIDFFPNSVSPNTTGDLRPPSGTTSWVTYSYPITIPLGTTGIKIVPLWGQLSKVAYDNIGVIIPGTPLTASIVSPLDGATVNTNFTISATAVVSPETVTNVYFYDDTTLLGNDPSFPYALTVGNAAWTGSHVLKVVAWDSNGNEATSAEVTVNIVPMPQPALTYPTNNAPNPIWPAASVNSIYNSSDTYLDRAGVSWFPWGDTSSRGNYSIGGGNLVKSYLTLNYAGVELNPSYNPATAYDASGMTTLHVDVWTTANQFAVQLQSTAGVNGNQGAIVPYPADGGAVTSNHWVSLDIPLSAYTNLNPNIDLAKLDQILWLDNGALPGDGVKLGDFYIDNVFFYNQAPIIQSPALSGTNFTLAVASQAGFNYVLQGTAALIPPSWTSIQTNAGTGSLLNFTIPITTGNPPRYFRIHME